MKRISIPTGITFVLRKLNSFSLFILLNYDASSSKRAASNGTIIISHSTLLIISELLRGKGCGNKQSGHN